jgi:thioesterase domain-containing protein
MNDRYKLEPDNNVIQAALPSFDVCHREVFSALTSSACLVLIPLELGGDAQYRYHLTVAYECKSVLLVVPSFIQYWFEQPATCVKVVGLGGEDPTPDLIDYLRGKVNEDCVVFNDYGPAEVTVSVCANPIEPESGKATIGSIYANSMVSVDTVNVGVDADLQLHGVGVAQGYRGLAGQTASTFLPSTVSGRMYSTGDLAHYTLSRDVMFVGRRDFQVKINGQRMELGEVEGVIRGQASVVDCIVVAVKRSTGRLQLAAFVHHSGGADGVDAVRSDVESSLPRFMWPSRYVRIEFVRRTASGKKDTKWYMSAAANGTEPSRGITSSPPRENRSTLPPKFARLARVWEAVLGTDKIDTTTNFFEAGGDSISAIRLVSDIRLEFPESSFTVKDAVQYPTLGEMMQHVIRRSGGALVDEVEVSTISRSLTNHSDGNSLPQLIESTSFTKLRRSHSRQTVICFPGLGWMGGEFADFVEVSNGYNILLANNPRGNEELQELVARVGDEIASRGHERVILLGHSMGGLVAYKVAEYLGGKVSVSIDVVMIDTHRPVPRQDDGGMETTAMVERLLGDKDMATAATRRRFKRNASLMNTWVMRKELEMTIAGAIVIEAGESSAEERRVKVATESKYNVPGADHFSILRWPHVLNVVAVVRNLLATDSGD